MIWNRKCHKRGHQAARLGAGPAEQHGRAARRGTAGLTIASMLVLAAVSTALITVASPSDAAYAGGRGPSSAPSHDPCYQGRCPCAFGRGASGHVSDVKSGFGGRCPCIVNGRRFNGFTADGRCPKYAPRPLEPRITSDVTIGPNNARFPVPVTGSGFDPGENVVITLDGVDHLGTVTANHQGGFQLTVIIPSGLRLGSHEITATGKTSGAEATLEITIVRGPHQSPPHKPKTKAARYRGGDHNSQSDRHEGFGLDRGDQGRGWSGPNALLVSSSTGTTVPPTSGGADDVLGALAGALALTGIVVLGWRRRRAPAGQS